MLMMMEIMVMRNDVETLQNDLEHVETLSIPVVNRCLLVGEG